MRRRCTLLLFPAASAFISQEQARNSQGSYVVERLLQDASSHSAAGSILWQRRACWTGAQLLSLGFGKWSWFANPQASGHLQTVGSKGPALLVLLLSGGGAWI